MEAYASRRARELRELASAVAAGSHQPQDIPKLIRDPATRKQREGQWETDVWWKTA